MSFSLFRDSGEWGAYEHDHDGRFRTLEGITAELVRLLTADVESAEGDLRMAKDKLERARQRLAVGPRIKMKALRDSPPGVE